MKSKIAVIGLGYVGLPLAFEFSKYFEVIAYDHDNIRVKELKKGYDRTNEIKFNKKVKLKNLKFTNNYLFLKNCDFIIIAVPTPVKKNKNPDLSHIINASKVVGKCIKKSSIVIYESTVYPGCIEEVCLPILEKNSKLRLNKDFYLGYSPERINPGKDGHKLTDIIKIVSGSNKYAVNKISKIYKKIIKAGIYKAESIKIAEAAKVIENTQRDLNIALVNELSIIFDKLNLDTKKIFNAAATKWNFVSYKPGLVGGHCIGVDPYYLTYKARQIKYNPEVILAGRKINDGMSKYIAKKVISSLGKKNKNVSQKRILIFGLPYKENCVDLRNSKVFDLIDNLQKKNISTHLFDPLIDKKNLKTKYEKMFLENNIKKNYYHAIIIAVGHKIFTKMGINKIKLLGKLNVKVFDLKGIFPTDQTYWQL